MMNGIVASALINVLAKAWCQTRSKLCCILSHMLTQKEPNPCYMDVMEGKCLVVMENFSFRDSGRNRLLSSHCCVHR